MNVLGNALKKLGAGKKAVVKRIRPKNNTFSIGKIFLLSDGIYVLEEITKVQRCSKRELMMLRPIKISTIIDTKTYVVHVLKGRGI